MRRSAYEWVRTSWRAPLREAWPAALITFLVVAVLAFAAARALRWLSWIGDLVALALPVAAVALLAAVVGLVVLRQSWLLVALALGLLAASAVAIGLPRLADTTGPPQRALNLAAVNLLFDNERPADAVASALASRPDVLVVSELTTATNRLLMPAFPYHIVTEELLVGVDNGQGVYSMFPLQKLPSPTGIDDEVLKVRVAGPEPFVLYAVHLPRPTLNYDGRPSLTSFSGHRTMTNRLHEQIESETGPVVLAGDLNLSDRTEGYDTLTDGRVDALRSSSPGTTFIGGWYWTMLMLRIDHIIVPGDWCAAGGRSFRLAGSDHRGIEATIGPCR